MGIISPTTHAPSANLLTATTMTINRKKTSFVPVLSARYDAGNNSVSLTLGNYKPGKPLQLRVSGLVAAGGAAVGAFETAL